MRARAQVCLDTYFSFYQGEIVVDDSVISQLQQGIETILGLRF